MSLSKYNEKRNFDATAEPKGKLGKSENELIFVVQKHAASHLHYDFRLELDGVLKSWAVPKGPSLDPEIKRLAMMVEDHPYSYKDFEGNIPVGNYGAGNVIVWDNGTYIPADSTDESASTAIKKGLEKGRLSFILKGKKLKGEFSLVKLKGKQENAWLLLKKTDKFATDKDILLKNKSVISKVTLEALEKKEEKTNALKLKVEKAKLDLKEPVLKNEKVYFIKPMLADSIEKPFDDNEWIFENKYDGYRTLAVINDSKVELFSRNKLSFNIPFAKIAEELKKISHNALLDGEIVVENAAHISSFQLLQKYIKTGEGLLKYYVFDILNLDGNDTTKLSLLERKELLKMLLNKEELSNIYYSEHVENKGIEFFEMAEKNKAEGIIAKKSDSSYAVGQRSKNWLKIKITEQEEAVIIGITESKNARSYFGALLLGQYVQDKLTYIGKVGTGFSEETLKELYGKFEPYLVSQSPVKDIIKISETVKWLEPKFVCQVKFTEWTADRHLRHPVFLGLRIDKNPKEVLAQSKEKIVKTSKDSKVPNDKALNSAANDFDLKVGKTTLHLTNQNKIYFPEDQITKGDIIKYYAQVADYMLPYLKDRPQSMNRFPNGISGQSFYQKDVDTAKIPSWLKTEQIHSESNKDYIDYLICNDAATLLYMINLGCIDINPWNSTIKNIENPDWAVIDIDPEVDDFKKVVQTALTVKEIMDALDSSCYCKTSGATGLHVYIPLGAKYVYDSVKIFAELIANKVHERLPDTTSLERSIKKRNHKIYIDYLQNRQGQTIAAPYAVRPKPGATVSTPLEWSEVNDTLSPSQFTIKNVPLRLKEKGDVWKPVLGKGVDLEKILNKMSEK